MTQWFLRLVWKNMAVITRWSYKRGGRKAGFHCSIWCKLIYEIIVSVHPQVNELPAGVFLFPPFRRAFLKRCVFGDHCHRIREDSRPKYAVQKYLDSCGQDLGIVVVARTRLWLASYFADVSYWRAIMLRNILSSIYRLDSCSEHSDWIHINLFRGEFAFH